MELTQAQGSELSFPSGSSCPGVLQLLTAADDLSPLPSCWR